jgi:hypothetical protein
MASALPTLPCVAEYDLDEDFCWAGNEDGFDFGDITKPNPFAGYLPSSNHFQVVSKPFLSSFSTTCISLPQPLFTAIRSLCKTLIWVLS